MQLLGKTAGQAVRKQRKSKKKGRRAETGGVQYQGVMFEKISVVRIQGQM